MILQTILYISHNVFFINYQNIGYGEVIEENNIAHEQYYQISLLNMQEKLHVTTEEKLAWNVDLHNV